MGLNLTHGIAEIEKFNNIWRNCYTGSILAIQRFGTSTDMRTIFSTTVLAFILAIPPVIANAQVKLITEAEAQAPNQPTPHTRAITRGPGISLKTPHEVVGKSFAFKILFEPRGGAKIDSASIKFEYLKQPPIDLTERFKSGLNGNQLELLQASVPVGTHPIRVSVRDTEGREGHTIIQLSAK